MAALLIAPGAVHAHAAPAVASPRPAATETPFPQPTPTPSATPTAPSSREPRPDEQLTDTVIQTVAYGRHSRQRMDVWWQPDSGERRPGVFLLHGGWWSEGDKSSMASITRGFAAMGYTVFNLNYRLSGDAAWPAQRVDALDAIQTARRHAERWSFDPNDYAVVGFSAGGHIATAVGTYRNGLKGLKGVVGISPVVSPMTAYRDGTDTLDLDRRKLRTAAIKLAGGCGPVRCEKVWRSMEVPLHASRRDAPMLTLHSAGEFVPAFQSELLKLRLRREGVGMSIRVVPGTGHSTVVYHRPGVAESVRKWVAAKLEPDAR